MTEPQFEFQKLDVYRVAMELTPVISEILAQLPTGTSDLRNQIKRSERSIRLNIAEGAGKHRPGGKTERYRTARGSANECAAALHEIRQSNLADHALTLRGLQLIHRIISMLTRLITRWEG